MTGLAEVGICIGVGVGCIGGGYITKMILDGIRVIPDHEAERERVRRDAMHINRMEKLELEHKEKMHQLAAEKNDLLQEMNQKTENIEKLKKMTNNHPK